jgi:hypothetical protein
MGSVVTEIFRGHSLRCQNSRQRNATKHRRDGVNIASSPRDRRTLWLPNILQKQLRLQILRDTFDHGQDGIAGVGALR